MKKAIVCVVLLVASSLAAWSDSGVLRVCDMTESPPSMSPFVNIDGKLSYLLRHVLGPWIDRDETHALIPGIFERWEVREPTQWTFKVRNGLEFSNGDPLTIEDVVFSIETVTAKDSALANEFGSVKAALAEDGETLTVITKAPDPILPSRFANRPFLVNKKEYQRVGGAKYFERPLGVWMYRFVSADRDSITIGKNPGFKYGPGISDRIVYRFIKDDVARIDALRNGEVDILTEIRPTMGLEIAKNPALRLLKVPASQYVALFLNALPAQNGIFANRDLRAALTYGINTDRILSTTLAGNGLKLATITMPQEFGYDAALKPRPYDAALAKRNLDAYIATSGASIPLKLKVAVVDYLENVLSSIKGQLLPLGIEIETVVLPRGKVLIDVITKKEIKVDAYIVDPTDPYLDASFQLNLENNPAFPSSFFHSPDLTKAIESANVEMNPGKRASLLQRAQQVLHGEYGSVPIYQKILMFGVSRKVKGFTPTADVYLRLEKVAVDR